MKEMLMIISWVVILCGGVLFIGLIVWLIIEVYTKLFESIVDLLRLKRAFLDFVLSSRKYNKYGYVAGVNMPEAEANELKRKLSNNRTE